MQGPATVTTNYPVGFTWDERDQVMRLLPRFGNLAAQQYRDAQVYRLVVVDDERNMKSHAHYFAALNEGFKTISERYAGRWDSVQHLREWLLIREGWYNETEIDCGTEKNAQRQLQYCTQQIQRRGHYTQVFISGSKIIFRDAKSQSREAMDRDTFERSKRDVLDALTHLLDVSRAELDKAAGRSS